MKTKLQKEKLSKKNKTIPTAQEDCIFEYAWFEKRLIPITIDKIEALARELMEGTESNEIFSIEEFCMKKKLRLSTLGYWAGKYPDLKEALNIARENIGAHRERGALTKQLDPRTLNYQWHFSKRFRDHDQREDERKVKLASQGVNQGETILKVVNENIKIESEKE